MNFKQLFNYSVIGMCIAMLSNKTLVANNIAVSSATITNPNTSAGVNNAANYSMVKFNLSWDNSWRWNSTGGSISYIAVKSGGSGYSSAPAISITGGGGNGATATATISGNRVTGITITNAGSGYTSIPTISFSGGGGSGATADAHINSWWDAAWVFVKFRVGASDPTFTGVSSSGNLITVNSTTNLRVGMNVVVTSGTGATSSGAHITQINSSVSFTVSGISIPLSNASIICYRIWEHAKLNNSGHVAATGSAIDVGLQTPGNAFDANNNPSVGVFIYRSNTGSGTNTFNNLQLRWNYGANGVNDNATVNVQVFAVEMVYVPQGSFFAGSGGNETGSFTDGSVSAATGAVNMSGTISSLQLITGGSFSTGYTSVPTIAFTGGGGTGAAATVSNMRVGRAVVTNPGIDYTSLPTIAFSGGGGTGATGTARMELGSITITNGGSGYTSAPTVTFSGGGGTGAGAWGTAVISGGTVTSVNIGSRGTNYASPPSITFSGGGGSGATATTTLRLAGISIGGSGGNNYTSSPTITITGGGGSGASADALLYVNGLSLTNGGSGYTGYPTVSFSGGGGSGATALANRSVSSITITSAGIGYTTAPAVSFSSGLATATATVSSGQVTAINVTSGGNYSSTPTVTIAAPPSSPYLIASENAINIASSAGSLWGASTVGESSIGSPGTLSANYPKGYNAFYCMKYEVTDGQYRDFLNTLSRLQQNARINTNISPGCGFCHDQYVMYIGIRNGGSIFLDNPIPLQGPVEFYNNNDGDGTPNEITDGEHTACGYLTWGHAAAYLDWSGLRPMTELEFEKVCRGIQSPVSNEYAWGNSSIQIPTSYTFSNSGAFNEVVSGGYSLTQGNVYYQIYEAYPLRVGIFADNAGNNGRMTSGASYYGIMDLTGNGTEYAVTVGNTNGRNYSGQHGDGVLSASGNANTTEWPGLVTGEITAFSGIGYRGVTYTGTTGLQLSARNLATLSTQNTNSMSTVRGVRAAQ